MRKIFKYIYSDNGINFVEANIGITEVKKVVARSKSSSDWCVRDTVTLFVLMFLMRGLWDWRGGHNLAKYAWKKEKRSLYLKNFSRFWQKSKRINRLCVKCLNPRPLMPILNNSLDLTTLTPGHFLIRALLNKK